MKENIEKIKVDRDFLQKVIFDLFVHHLEREPSFIADHVHRVRNMMLEITERLFPIEGMSGEDAAKLARLMIRLLTTDNEENAAVCLRIFTDLHKTYAKAIENEVPNFLNFVVNSFERFDETVKYAFSHPPPKTEQEKAGYPIVPATRSFKILTECPIITAQLFRAFQNRQNLYISKLYPMCVKSINVQAPPHAHEYKALYSDFIAAQTKAVSFLAHILKSLPESRSSTEIMTGVINLIKNCPQNSEAIRKELLVATRHFIGNFKKGFRHFIDVLIDENILIGTLSSSKHESIRQLAYSAVADLIYHARDEFEPSQLSRVITLFCKNIHDHTLPLSTQTLSVRLLLSMVEQGRDQNSANLHLLIRILETLINKFSSLKDVISQLAVKVKDLKPKSIKASEAPEESADVASTQPEEGDKMEIETNTEVKTTLTDEPETKALRTSLQETVDDYRALVRALAIGVRNVIYVIYEMQKTTQIAFINETDAITQLFRNSLKCLTIYSSDFDLDLDASFSPIEKKEFIVDHIAVAITSIDNSLFYDVMSSQIGYLYDFLIEYSTLFIQIPQKCFNTPHKAHIFSEILLNFLIDKIPRLAVTEKNEGTILLALFKLLFSTIDIYKEEAEIHFRPHLPGIISQTIKLSAETSDPKNYFLLIRNLMRSISKTSLFSKELIQLLPALLENFGKLQESSHSQQLKDLFVELSLTIPAPLCVLLPCIRSLMKPIVLSIESESEIQGGINRPGFKMLETFIDKLSPEFLEPIIQEFKPRVMKALWKHLRLPPYPIAPLVLRIFGKMSGRNRNIFTPPQLDLNISPNSDLYVSLPFKDNIHINFPLKDAILSAQRMLLSSALSSNSHISLSRKRQFYNLFKVCASIIVGTKAHSDSNTSNFTPHERPFSNVGGVGVATIAETDLYPRNVIIDDEELGEYVKTKKQLESDYSVVKIIFSCILRSSIMENIEEDNKEFFDKICTHFALLFIAGTKPHTENLDELDPYVFIDSIVEVITSENRAYVPAAIGAVDNIIKCADKFGPDVKADLGALHVLATHLCNNCYKKEWYYKAGGTAGIAHLADSSRMPISWIRTHQLNFIKALFFVIQDLLPATCFDTQDLASKTILSILQTCNSSYMNEDITESPVVHYLATQLSSPNHLVRKNVQSCLDTLAEINGYEVTELLEKHKDDILRPILQHPLQKIPTKVQMGYLDTLTFCLNLRPPLLSFTPELISLLNEVVAIGETDDARSKTIVGLKVTAVEVMAASVGCSDFGKDEFDDLRNKMIGIFLKSMVIRNKQIVNAAAKGLEQMATQKESSEPILSNLRVISSLLNPESNRKPSESHFEGLSRLLTHLNKYFKVNLGDRLLEFLKMYIGQENHPPVRPMKSIEDTRIPALVIENFHLLPEGAERYLEPLVNSTILLEKNLPTLPNSIRRQYIEVSPFRHPLSKFMNIHPKDTLRYFLPKLDDPELNRLFRSILLSEYSPNLREELAQNSRLLLDSTFNKMFSREEFTRELRIQGLLICRALVKFIPNWLNQKSDVLNRLLDVWKSLCISYERGEYETSRPFICEQKLVGKCLINYYKGQPENPSVLFELLAIFGKRVPSDLTYLESFFLNYIPAHFAPSIKKTILLKFLETFDSNEYSLDIKVQSMRLLVIPLLVHCFEKNEEGVIDDTMITNIVNKVLVTTSVDTKSTNLSSEQDISKLNGLHVESLRLATLLIKYKSETITPHKKELITFAWHHLKSEDLTTRQSSYIFVCRFIETFETPEKIILQVYVALLKAHQEEAKSLVRDALDILVPTLGVKLSKPNDPSPIWVKWTKKIFVEEGHSPHQLIHILHLLVRHSQYFYPYRAEFVNHMVNSLRHVPNVPAENRILAVSIVELIINWEQKRVERIASGVNDPVAEKEDFFLPQQTIELIINFLVRISINFPNPESKDKTSLLLAKQSLALLGNAFKVWPTANVKTSYFERILSQNYKEEQEIHKSMLKILCVILEHKILNLEKNDLTRIEKVLLHILTTKQRDVAAQLCKALALASKQFPPCTNSPLESFYNEAYLRIDQALKKDIKEDKDLEPIAMIVNQLVQDQPLYLDKFATVLANLITLLQKNHIKRVEPTEAAKHVKLDSTYLTTSIVNMGKLLPTLHSDIRATFFSNIYQLITASLDEQFLVKLLSTIHEWFKDENITIHLADKQTFIERMRRFEKVRSLPLHRHFLDLVYHVYTTGSEKGEDVSCFEPVFMIGLCSKDPSIRYKFFDIFNGRIEEGIYPRFLKILNNNTWKSLPHLYWIQQSVELLYSQVEMDAPLKILRGTPAIPALFSSFSDTNYEKLSEDAKELLSSHLNFYKELIEIPTQSLIKPLKDLIYHDVDLASQQWAFIFSNFWNHFMSSEQQIYIKESAETLIRQQDVGKQRQYLTTVQSLTKGFRLCNNPPIVLQPLLLKLAGRYFNGWHVSIRTLEDRLYTPHLSFEEKYEICYELADLYESLGEMDHYYSVYNAIAQVDDTKMALTYEKYDRWQYAQAAYYVAMDDASKNVLTGVDEKEQEFWESRWIECTKKLNQWDVLGDYAKTCKDGNLLFEACWKIGDWDGMKDAFSRYKIDPDPYKVKIMQCYSFLQDSKIQEVDEACKLAMTSLVTQWTSLPKSPSPAFTPLLQAFQQIIELYESAKIVKDLNPHTSVQQTSQQRLQKLGDIRNSILKQWRERLPNVFDDISIWYDLLQWRQHVFSLINASVSQDRTEPRDPILGFGNYEMAWVINKLAHVTRKQGLTDVSLNFLSKIYHIPNIEVQDAFVKLKVHVKCYAEVPKHYRVGLDVINSTNLEYFNKEQKSDFYLLKGNFLSLLGNYEEASKNFSTSIVTFEGNSKAWIAWAKYFDRLFDISLEVGSAKSRTTYAVHSITSYLQSLKCSTVPSCRKHIARVFWLLNFDEDELKTSAPQTPLIYSPTMNPLTPRGIAIDSKDMDAANDILADPDEGTKKREAPEPDWQNTKKLQKTTETSDESNHLFIENQGREDDSMKKKFFILASTLIEHAKEIPAWVWVIWIPQIISGLTLPEQHAMKQLLLRVASFYPNALYFNIKTFVEEQREKLSKEGINEKESSEFTVPLRLGEEVLGSLVQKFPLLISEFDKLSNELQKVLCPTTQESLLTMLHAIRNNILKNGDVTAKIALVLGQIQDFYQLVTSHAGEDEFFEGLRQSFEEDFFAENVAHSLEDIEELLRKYIDTLTDKCSRLPNTVELDKSLWISQYQNDTFLELPGQYYEDKETSTDTHVILEKIESPVKIIRSVGLPNRIISLRGSNGKVYNYFAEDTSFYKFSINESFTNSDGSLQRVPTSLLWNREHRLAHSLRAINRILKKNLQTRKRCVQLLVPNSIPFSPHFRLISTDLDITTLQDVFDEWALTKGMVPTSPQYYARRKYLESNVSKDVELKMYKEIVDSIPMDILLNYVSDSLADCYDDLWHFRKFFATQLGISSLIQYLFSIESTTPSHYGLLLKSAQIYNAEFYPVLNNDGLLRESKPSPFRLTPNIQRLAGYNIVDGRFESSFTSSVMAISQDKEKELLRNYFNLNFRDYLLDMQREGHDVYDLTFTTMRNTEEVLKRIGSLQPNMKPPFIPSVIQSMNHQVVDLIKNSVDPVNLSQMDVSWIPWL